MVILTILYNWYNERMNRKLSLGRITLDVILGTMILPTLASFIFFTSFPQATLEAWFGVNPNDVSQTTGIGALVGTITSQIGFLALPLFRKWKKDLPEEALVFSKPSKREVLIIIATFLGLTGFDLIYGQTLLVLGVTIPSQLTLVDRGALSFLFLFIGGVIIGPTLEEIFFRGYLLPALKPRGIQLSLLMSAVIFALVHFQVFFIPLLLLTGYVLGYVYLKTKNLFVPIAIHMLSNSLAFLATVLGLQ